MMRLSADKLRRIAATRTAAVTLKTYSVGCCLCNKGTLIVEDLNKSGKLFTKAGLLRLE